MKVPYQTRFFSKPKTTLSRWINALFAVVLLCALVCGSALPALAQTFRGSILGTITDATGAAVAEATVTAKNILTGVKRSTTTDDAGNYTITELPIGDYEVRVDARGFPRHIIVTNVKVEVAGERRIDVMVEATGRDEEVTITGLDNLAPHKIVKCTVSRDGKMLKEFELLCKIDTDVEVEYLQHGGILQYVHKKLV